MFFRTLISYGALACGLTCFWQVPQTWEKTTGALSVPAGSWRDGLKRCTVVIDAGHGGNDTGTSGHEMQEKEVTLDLAKRLENHLCAAGVKVRMTRDKDTYVRLEERCAIANETHADAFVSLHLNASESSEASGLETYYSSRKSFEDEALLRLGLGLPAHTSFSDQRSIWLGHVIQRQATQASGLMDRGVRDCRFLVVKHTHCPAVLVECGYLSNREDALKLEDGAYREKLTAAIADGLCRYLLASRVNPRRGIVLGEKKEAEPSSPTGDKDNPD